MPFPVGRFGMRRAPSSRGGAEAIRSATLPDDAEPWIATASPRNDGEVTEVIERTPYQRMPLEIVPAISSAAWITFEFISKARWAVIRLVISLTGSTFEPSR